MLSILVSSPKDVVNSNANENNVDAAIFSNENGILTMEKSAGRQGLSRIGVLDELTKFKGMIAPFAGS
jgi:hypothetical protein